MEVSYNLKFAKTAALKSVRFHVSGVNLATWDKIGVVDPETPTGSTGAVYPQTMGLSFGASLSF